MLVLGFAPAAVNVLLYFLSLCRLYLLALFPQFPAVQHWVGLQEGDLDGVKYFFLWFKVCLVLSFN